MRAKSSSEKLCAGEHRLSQDASATPRHGGLFIAEGFDPRFHPMRYDKCDETLNHFLPIHCHNPEAAWNQTIGDIGLCTP